MRLCETPITYVADPPSDLTNADARQRVHLWLCEPVEDVCSMETVADVDVVE
jgi:hypothetical protein